MFSFITKAFRRQVPAVAVIQPEAAFEVALPAYERIQDVKVNEDLIRGINVQMDDEAICTVFRIAIGFDVLNESQCEDIEILAWGSFTGLLDTARSMVAYRDWKALSDEQKEAVIAEVEMLNNLPGYQKDHKFHSEFESVVYFREYEASLDV